MKPNTYKVLSKAVEDGASYAWKARIFKYTEFPSDDAAIQSIYDAIMSEISEVFEFDE